MSKTSIEWCARPGTIPETWNPTTGCNKVSQGCKNCYAEIMHKRLQAMGQKKYQHDFLEGAFAYEDVLSIPLKWTKPRTVFVNSMSDLFHENISFEFIDAVFRIMADVDMHTYIVLTKRPERMVEFFTWKHEQWGIKWISPPNVWLGVSVEDQKAADERIPELLKVPAAVRFLSCEPLLSKVDLNSVKGYIDCLGGLMYKGFIASPAIDWVICGGESGNKARPMHPVWAQSLRDQCKAAGVSFFFKQWGEYAQVDQKENGFALWSKGIFNNDHANTRAIMKKVGKKKAGRLLDDQEHNEFPN